jgi:hypothetical protein
MHRLPLVTLFSLVAATAHAEPPPPADTERGFVSGGILVGGDHFPMIAWSIEAGWKLPDVPLWVHVQGATGAAGDPRDGVNVVAWEEHPGDLKRGVVGIENRSCSSPGLCIFVGGDVGYQRQIWPGPNSTEFMSGTHQGAIGGARIGLDVGGERVRFRIGFDLYAYRHHDDAGTPPGWEAGGTLTTALALRL